MNAETELEQQLWVERRTRRAPVAPVSIVIPAKNEAAGLAQLLPTLRAVRPDAPVVVVDDGSTDDTATVCKLHGAEVVKHPYPMGNGAAIKAGMRATQSDVVVLMDADGQHDPADVTRLLELLDQGYDMAIGARNWGSQATVLRGVANSIYNRLAGYVVGRRVPDLTSGFRAVRRSRFVEFMHLLPNGFSYPTTITMAFFRMGYPVGYLPITAHRRSGPSHVRPIRDGIRFLLIIFKVTTLYAPFKLFFPVSVSLFSLGAAYYAYTLSALGRFTNMSALLFSTAIIVFLIGLVSEQITSLAYGRAQR